MVSAPASAPSSGPKDFPWTCLVRFTDYDKGIFNSSTTTKALEDIRASVNSQLDLYYMHSQPKVINKCIYHLLNNAAFPYILARIEGAYTACKTCVQDGQPCVRFLRDRRPRVNRRKLSTVLVPAPEIFRIGIRARERGFWVLEGENGDVPWVNCDGATLLESSIEEVHVSSLKATYSLFLCTCLSFSFNSYLT